MKERQLQQRHCRNWTAKTLVSVWDRTSVVRLQNINEWNANIRKCKGKYNGGDIKTTVWDTAPCTLVEIDKRFRGVYCLQHHHSPLHYFVDFGKHILRPAGMKYWSLTGCYPRSSQARFTGSLCFMFQYMGSQGELRSHWFDNVQWLAVMKRPPRKFTACVFWYLTHDITLPEEKLWF
jgi:hypothetical protein